MSAKKYRMSQYKKDLLLLSAVAALLQMKNGSIGVFTETPEHAVDPFRKCIRCGKARYHNNAFCSAECCKLHRAEKKVAS